MRNNIKALARVNDPESFVSCPWCEVEVKARNLVKHFDRNHQYEALLDEMEEVRERIKGKARTYDPDSFISCPFCSNEVKAKNLVKHLDRNHSVE